MNEPNPAPVLTPEQEAAANFMCLVANLRRAKATEEQAKSNRIKLEEMVAALVPGSESGQVTAAASDGTKVTVKRGLNYKADLEAIETVLSSIPDGHHTDSGLPAPIAIKTTRSLDIKGYEWYKEHHPGPYGRMSAHVTVTPKKVAVSLH